MRAETWGLISASIVALSAIPYALNTWAGKAKPNLTSWSLWSVIGFALLVTYRDSRANSNLWPAWFGLINPTCITILAIIRHNKLEPMTFWEKLSVIGCIASLALWYKVQDNKDLAQFALYLAIAADMCAAIPTFVFVLHSPHEDRPGPWILFAVGYLVSLLAITDHTFSNYILPLYMGFGTLAIAWILAVYRFRQRSPIRQWI